MASIRRKALFGLFVCIGVSCGGPTPEKAGDECEQGGDPCPDGTQCISSGSKYTCQVPQGGKCDLSAAYCESPYQCVADAHGSATCGIPAGGACDPTSSKCGGNLVCEEVDGGTHACYLPVFIEGKVFDAQTTTGIAGAHVIALDSEATAITDVAITDEAGNYDLPIPNTRTKTGEPHPDFFMLSFTLRADAAGYQTFPGGVRTALPIDASGAKKGSTGWVIATPLTQIALLKLPAKQQGGHSISGQVKADKASGGVLVIADSGMAAVSAVSDLHGNFTIFNAIDGAYTVMGYAAGLQLTPAKTSVKGADVTGVALAKSTAALGSISGSVNLVDAPGGSMTSVVLVVASTFNEKFVHGDVPKGLRTPLTGAPNVTGTWTIKDVPQGKYKVLAAFENDDLVQDPDPNIAGTQILEVDMAAPGAAQTLDTPFKITGALPLLGPGKDQAEAVSDPPTFSWGDDSSEAYYSVDVFDSFGNVVWNNPNFVNTGGATVTLKYGGPKLQKGMYYQFRVTSIKTQPSVAPITRTEDLRGVFFLK